MNGNCATRRGRWRSHVRRGDSLGRNYKENGEQVNKKNPAQCRLLITPSRILKNDAEGGTRTRTAFWARGFSYHYSFRYLPSLSSLTVCGLDDAFSMHVSLPALFEQANKRCLGGSRLVSTLCWRRQP